VIAREWEQPDEEQETTNFLYYKNKMQLTHGHLVIKIVYRNKKVSHCPDAHQFDRLCPDKTIVN
jgi:hypothetical protein